MKTRFAKLVLAFSLVALIHVAPSFGQPVKRSTAPPAYVWKVTVHVNEQLFYEAAWKDKSNSIANPIGNADLGPANTRLLITSRSQPLSKKGTAEVSVYFSRPVKDAKFLPGMTGVPRELKLQIGNVWRGTFDIGIAREKFGEVARIPLLITATDPAQDRSIDGNPGTIPQWEIDSSKTHDWRGVDTKWDLNHWVSLRNGYYRYETERFWRVAEKMNYDEVVVDALGKKYTFPLLSVPPACQIEATLEKLAGYVKKFQIKDLSPIRPRDIPLNEEGSLSSIKRHHVLEFTNALRQRSLTCGVVLEDGKSKRFQLRVRLIDRGDLGTHTDAGDIKPASAGKPDTSKNGLDIPWNEWQTANLFGNDTVDYFRLPNVPKGTSVWVEIRRPDYYESYAGGKKTISGSSIKLRMLKEIFVNAVPKREKINHPPVEVNHTKRYDCVSSEYFRSSEPCNIWFKVETTKSRANVSYQIRVRVADSIELPKPVK